VQVFAATNGFLDRILTDRVPEFLDGLLQRMHSEHSDLLEKVSGGDWSDETQEALRNAVADFADDFGYDLDEEGQPLLDSGVGATTRAEEGLRSAETDAAADAPVEEEAAATA
jgi:F-type H+-transporting ATPase subunit alpha